VIDENGQMQDAIERKLGVMQHLEVSEKCLDIILKKFSGVDGLFDYIGEGHGKSFMSVIAIMSSYRIVGQDMIERDYESWIKIACFHLIQSLEEEFRPMMAEIHAQVVSDIYDN
jgi:hypothetical protein